MLFLDMIAPILSPSLFLFTSFMILCVVLEAFVIQKILKRRSKTAFFHSFIANLVTTIIGFWYIDFMTTSYHRDAYIPLFLSGFSLSIAIEMGVLKLLNKEKQMVDLGKTALFMNIVSYLLLILIFVLFQ